MSALLALPLFNTCLTPSPSTSLPLLSIIQPLLSSPFHDLSHPPHPIIQPFLLCPHPVIHPALHSSPSYPIPSFNPFYSVPIPSSIQPSTPLLPIPSSYPFYPLPIPSSNPFSPPSLLYPRLQPTFVHITLEHLLAVKNSNNVMNILLLGWLR
ncbi:hypothetical protein Pcinc_033071 [Petrolisthes cinctipes]|uniref:Uncharacterized protein n=1 Tax=Petrolisthes cinctipes TaxID=88211 RepID=A0AAE1ET67_PETCI|nr:hypothetical protein Pcinc_033071 [Petrolisthes cinctipes]